MGCPSFRMFWITSFFAMYFVHADGLGAVLVVAAMRKKISISLPGEVNALDGPPTGTASPLAVCAFSCGQTTFSDNQRLTHFEHSLC